MEITLLLIKKIISLFIILLLGVIIVRFKLIKSEDSKVLSILMLYLVTPCVILNAFQVDYTPEILKGLLMAAGAAVIVHAVWLLIIQLMGKPFKLHKVEKMSIVYTNAGNLIIPIVTSVLGPDMVIYSSAYMAVQLLLIWSHCKTVMSGESSIDWKKLLTNANLICVFLGIITFAFHFKFPSLVKDTMDSLSSMIGPAAMLVIGMIIGGMNLKKLLQFKRLPLVILLRLIVFPLIMLVIFKFIPVNSIVENGKMVLLVTFLACTTPSASTVTQMAQVYGEQSDAEYASAINVSTTILCLISMPIMVMLYQLFI